MSNQNKPSIKSRIKHIFKKIGLGIDECEIKLTVNSVWRKTALWIGSIAGVIIIGGGIGLTAHHVHHEEYIQEIKDNPSIQAEIQRRKNEKRFIKKMAKPAVTDYENNQRALPSITIAQAIVESNWGSSDLYKDDNNIFGIKGKYYGKSQIWKTHEENQMNQMKTVKSRFKKYPNQQASIHDHSVLLNKVFLKKKGITNYKKDAHLLKRNHYATDKAYPQKLDNVIKLYHLHKYDKKAEK